MAKIDRVDSVEAQEPVSMRPTGGEAENKRGDMAMATEQLHLIPPPAQDDMVRQILERQAVFGF